MVGLFGTLFFLVATFRLGSKKRDGFLLFMVGDAVWLGVGLSRSHWDMVLTSTLFIALAVRNWVLWGGSTTKGV